MMQIQLQHKLCTQTIELPEIGRITYTLLEVILPSGERYYSITVEMNGPLHRECSSVPNITCNRQLALRMFWMVCRGTVTPCTLTDILSDLLP